MVTHWIQKLYLLPLVTCLMFLFLSFLSEVDIPLDMGVFSYDSLQQVESSRADSPSMDIVTSSQPTTPPPKRNKVQTPVVGDSSGFKLLISQFSGCREKPKNQKLKNTKGKISCGSWTTIWSKKSGIPLLELLNFLVVLISAWLLWQLFVW